MGLYNTVKDAELGRQAREAEATNRAKAEGIQTGKQMRDLEIERQIARQDLIEKQANDAAKRAFDQEMIRKRQEAIIAGQMGQDRNNMQMAPDATGAEQPMMGNGSNEVPEDLNATALQILETKRQLEETNPNQVSAFMDKIKNDVKNNELSAEILPILQDLDRPGTQQQEAMLDQATGSGTPLNPITQSAMRQVADMNASMNQQQAMQQQPQR